MSDENSDYAEAQTRIAQVAAEQTGGLYLRRLKITKLPPEIAQLTQLTRLDLSGTEITDLTPLANMTLLTRLNLSGTPI